MDEMIPDNFSGILGIYSCCDSFFSLNNGKVTVIPRTMECRNIIINPHKFKHIKTDSQWLYGISEDNKKIAFLKRQPFSKRISSPLNLGTAYFFTPLIVKGDAMSFDAIEFRGGIVDILHNPDIAVDVNINCMENFNAAVVWRGRDYFTRSYDAEINGEKINITCSVDTLRRREAGKVPDIKRDIHSYVRFSFETVHDLDDILKYYSYAVTLFQFCVGALNVRFETVLYNKESGNSHVKIISDGFTDCASERLNFMNVIRLFMLGDKLPALLKILNEEKTSPKLLFLPDSNTKASVVSYSAVSDLCSSIEREYSLSEDTSREQQKQQAKILADEIIAFIDSEKYKDYPSAVKDKAKNLLASNLKAFSPSLKEKFIFLYDKFGMCMRKITEQGNHDEYGICRFYSDDEFRRLIGKFVQMRNTSSHSKIKWDDEALNIFVHLKILVYFNILSRSGFNIEDSAAILSWLYGRYF